MLMNIVTLVINHLLGKTSASAAGPGLFPMFSRENVRKTLMICAGLSGSLVLFLGGFFTVLLDLILTSREQEQLLLSPASIVGFSLIGVSLLFMVSLFSHKVWKTMAPHPMQSELPAISPVQEAMAELIRDFVQERQLAREVALAQFATQSHQSQEQQSQERRHDPTAASMEPTMTNSETDSRPHRPIFN